MLFCDEVNALLRGEETAVNLHLFYIWKITRDKQCHEVLLVYGISA